MSKYVPMQPVPAVQADDVPWVMAAAMLESLAEDLALTLRAEWWKLDPEEMLPAYPEAAGLIEELRSERVQHLMDAVTSGTRGAVQCQRGWLMRQVRHMAANAKGKLTDFSRAKVAEKIRLPSLVYCQLEVPTGGCRDCGSQSVQSGRCASCKEERNKRVRAARERLRNIPPAAIPLKRWATMQAHRMGISCKAVLYRLQVGKIAMPPVAGRTSRSIWVLPEDQAAQEVAA